MLHQLVPLRDVVETAGEYYALSKEPWLQFTSPLLTSWAGCLVEFTYRVSYWDDPRRPIFRFQMNAGTSVEVFAPAPVVGVGIYIGRVPECLKSLSISPTDKAGPFSFMIMSVRKRSWLSLMMHGCRHNPRASRSAFLTRALGWREESDNNLAWAIGSTRLSSYTAWRKKRSWQLELKADIPRANWQDAAPIHLWMTVTSHSPALNATITSLKRQIFPHWILHLVGHTPMDLSDDDRIRCEESLDHWGENTGLIGRLAPGDELRPYALACLYETAHRHADAQVFYGDEEEQQPDGSLLPVFKPAWDALLHGQHPFHGRCVFVRGPVSNFTTEEKRQFVTGALIGDRFLGEIDHTSIRAISRILMTTRTCWQIESHVLEPVYRREATVSIIIPTKDHAEFLTKLVHSIRQHTPVPTLRLIIVDNGSSDHLAKSFLDQLREQKDVTLVEHPGPFNFSSMCNAGAVLSQSDVLVFLNNDMEVVSEDWLERITAWALHPRIGAVGAKLTYPNGLTQHLGVVLGMGGSAGHFGSFDATDAPGWAQRNMYVHKVSAVTGACLAIDRKKFQAVGGFDEVNLPVELSDIDLCLKLSEKGWTTIIDPAIHLIHEESATRGRATFRRLNVYQDQRAYFVNRWRHVLRNDPYFHPALSLFHWRSALG